MNRIDAFQEYWRQVNEVNSKSEGKVLNLGMGMPPTDVFRTPQLLTQKLNESIDAGDYNLYVPPEGSEECRLEIAEYENSLLPPGARPYSAESVMFVPGGIQAFSTILMALASADDPIPIPTPSYFSLTAQSEGHAPTVPLPCDDGYNFRGKDLNLALADVAHPGLMWLCQPNNPTGLYIPADELSEMIDITGERNSYLVIDESCDNYRFSQHGNHLPHNITSDVVIRIRTFSKNPNFAGYRLGYMLAEPQVLERLKRVVPMIYGNPTVMATRAVLAEFQIRNGKIKEAGDYEQLALENHALMRKSRDFLYSALRKSDYVAEVIKPEACYYLFARFHFPGTGMEFFHQLLHRQMLDVVPGAVFGAPANEAWVRICFARTTDVLQDGLDRIGRILSLSVTLCAK
jgi:aminotransferase